MSDESSQLERNILYMKSRVYWIGVFLLVISGCSSDNDILLPDEPTDQPIIGVYTKENQWVYEQMNHYYLWREDLPDSLSCDYTTDPVTFYKALLSPKDRFSYCSRNINYTSLSERLNDGFAYQAYRNAANENLLQVLYVTSPELQKQKLRRGDWLRKISTFGNTYERGEIRGDIFQPIDTLAIEALPSGTSQSTVYLDSIYPINKSKIGYLCYMEFDETKDLELPIRKFHENRIDELILDLRYNPGGYVRTCRYLCNSIVSEKGYKQLFQQCTYNDKVSKEYQKETGSSITKEYYDVPTNGIGQLLGGGIYGLNLKRLYVLTSKNTASASEATIICLRPYMDVIVIGEQTYGKGVGSWTIAEKQYKYELHPIIMRYYNSLMETTPDEGIPTNIEIAGGYETVKRELGDKNEPLLAMALKCIETGSPSFSAAMYSTRTKSTGLIPVGEPSFFDKTKKEY